MPSWLLYLLLALAVYRGTRLVTTDEVPLVKIPRIWLTAYLDPDQEQVAKYGWAKPRFGGLGKSIAYLVECDWCASVWVSALMVWLAAGYTSVPLPWLAWPALAAIAGYLRAVEPE